MAARYVRGAVALAVIGALAAGEQSAAVAQVVSQDYYNFRPFPLVAAGSNNPGDPPAGPLPVTSQSNFTTPSQFRNVLRRVNPALCQTGDLQNCIDQIRDESIQFNGVAAISGGTFLNVAQTVAQGPKPTVSVRGRILPSCLNDFGPGYRFDHQTSDLRLCLVVETTTTPQTGTPTVEYEFFDVTAVHVRVDNGAGGTASNAFPTAAAMTGIKIGQSGAFDHKLYAWGSNIQVREYWKTSSTDDDGNPDWLAAVKHTPQNPGTGEIRHLFNANEDACIDMMFAGYPPTHLGGYAGGIDYCLGRCAWPPIVNTM